MLLSTNKGDDVAPFKQLSLDEVIGRHRNKIFLSHRGPEIKDKLVRPLAYLLKQIGLRIFFDQDSKDGIQGGQINSEEMRHALWGSKCVVLFLTPKFCESKWCVKEANTAIALQQTKQPERVVLPVYCLGTQPGQSQFE